MSSEASSGRTDFLGARKLVCVTVGLPARGKTFIAQKIKRYMRWLGLRTRVFNVGEYRRRLCDAGGRNAVLPGASVVPSHEFFDNQNLEANRLRKEFAMIALDDLVTWLLATPEEDQASLTVGTPSVTTVRAPLFSNLEANRQVKGGRL